MSTLCGKVANSILLSCDNPLVPGLANNIYVFNMADIAFTFDATNPQLVNAISLAAGVYGYIFQSINNNVSALQKGTQTPAGPRFDHEIDFDVLAYSSAVNEQILQIMTSRVCIIVENLYRSGGATDSTFNIYGGQYGLICADAERKADDETSSGAWKLKFKNAPKTKQSTPVWTFYNTSYSATLAAILAQIKIADGGTKA